MTTTPLAPSTQRKPAETSNITTVNDWAKLTAVIPSRPDASEHLTMAINTIKKTAGLDALILVPDKKKRSRMAKSRIKKLLKAEQARASEQRTLAAYFYIYIGKLLMIMAECFTGHRFSEERKKVFPGIDKRVLQEALEIARMGIPDEYAFLGKTRLIQINRTCKMIREQEGSNRSVIDIMADHPKPFPGEGDSEKLFKVRCDAMTTLYRLRFPADSEVPSSPEERESFNRIFTLEKCRLIAFINKGPLTVNEAETVRDFIYQHAKDNQESQMTFDDYLMNKLRLPKVEAGGVTTLKGYDFAVKELFQIRNGLAQAKRRDEKLAAANKENQVTFTVETIRKTMDIERFKQAFRVMQEIATELDIDLEAEPELDRSRSYPLAFDECLDHMLSDEGRDNTDMEVSQ